MRIKCNKAYKLLNEIIDIVVFNKCNYNSDYNYFIIATTSKTFSYVF